jgi:hypothetical protein
LVAARRGEMDICTCTHRKHGFVFAEFRAVEAVKQKSCTENVFGELCAAYAMKQERDEDEIRVLAASSLLRREKPSTIDIPALAVKPGDVAECKVILFSFQHKLDDQYFMVSMHSNVEIASMRV